jgi:hypothetical protein
MGCDRWQRQTTRNTSDIKISRSLYDIRYSPNDLLLKMWNAFSSRFCLNSFFLEPEWMKVFFTISFRLLDVQRALDQCRSNSWETRLVIFKRGRVGQVRKSECWLMPLGIIFGTYEFSYRKESQRQWSEHRQIWLWMTSNKIQKSVAKKRKNGTENVWFLYYSGVTRPAKCSWAFFCINSVFTRLGWHKRKTPFPVVESPPLSGT